MDFRVKILRVSGIKKKIDDLERLFNKTRDTLKENGFDILSPIQREEEASLAYLKIVFMSKKGINTNWLNNLATQFGVYLTVHFLDYGEMKEYFYIFSPKNKVIDELILDFELDGFGNAIFSEDSPSRTDKLYLFR